MNAQTAAIAKIRSFNRFYTNVLGLLDRHILHSDFSLTEARLLLEIAKNPNCKAHELGLRLQIDRSYVSRMIKRFEAEKLIIKTPSLQDNRYNDLQITDAGQKKLNDLSGRSDAQVFSLIKDLSPQEVSQVLDAMALVREKLSRAAFPAVIRPYREGDAEYIVQRHEELYRKEYGLSASFADYVKRTVYELAGHYNPARECILIPEIDGRPLGSVAIVKYDDQTAQFRFFLLEPEARGYGLGLRLMEAALDFCRKTGYTHVFLETISLLTTARTIYHRMGFRVTQAHLQTEWGREVLEERWDLDL
ncbi:MAG: helix-turn-helix domain-containing GNAT family N-acetyltransferase [Eubacteriales bacterium]|nr:helix-turn-helix domain-containing GNAT family N-acetyltransferase [Eubacteriales bacterium]